MRYCCSSYNRLIRYPRIVTGGHKSLPKRQPGRLVGKARPTKRSTYLLLWSNSTKGSSICNVSQDVSFQTLYADALLHITGEASQLLPHLLRLSREHHALGVQLRDDIDGFESHLREIVDREWPSEQGELESLAPTTVPKPPKPVLPKDAWKSMLTEI